MFKINLHIARHVETNKNRLGIHGHSSNCDPTEWTENQYLYLINYCKKNNIKKIIYAQTSQCKLTSNTLTKALGLNETECNLKPIDLKEFSGMSQKDLYFKNHDLARAMEQFRYRVLSYKETSLSKLTSPEILSSELLKWDQNHGVIDENTLLILSSSLIVKIANLYHGILPSSLKYKNIGVANSGIVNLNEWHPDKLQWPDVSHKKINTILGNVILTEYFPTISPYKEIVIIIYPGIFGSSRFGPYNLFNRLARKLANYGFKSILFDPIGSGESTPLYRSLETELTSINSIISKYNGTSKIVFCAHSLSANIINKYVVAPKIRKFLIAPILDIPSRREAWNVSKGDFVRHGLVFAPDFWLDDSLDKFNEFNETEYFFGSHDKYVKSENFINNKRINHIIKNAGHNFSEGNTSNILIEKILSRTINYFWEN